MDNQTDPSTAGAPSQPVYGPPPVDTYSRSDEINPQKGYGGPTNIGSVSQNFGAIGSAIASAPSTIANAPGTIAENEAAPAKAVDNTFSPVGADTWKNFQDGLSVGAYSSESDQRQYSLHDSITSKIEDIQKASGATIPNPYSGGFADEASQQVLAQNQGKPTTLAEHADQTWLTQLSMYEQALRDLNAKHQGDSPGDAGIRAAIEPALNMNDYADQWVKDAQSKAQMDLAKSNGSLLPWLAQQGGVMAGSFRNPINALGLMVGGPELGIGSAVGRVLMEGVSQAAIQMGLTGVQEPGHQARAEQLGEEHGFWPVMHDLEDSALGGFIGGGVLKAIHEIPNLFGSADQGVATEEFLRRAQDLPPPGGWPAGSESRGQAWRREMDEWAAQQNASKGAVVPYEGPDVTGTSVEENAGPPPNEPSVAARATAAPPPPPKLNTAPEIANLPKTTAVTPTAIEARELDAAAAPNIPPEQTRTDALETYAGLIRSGENPDAVAKPLLPPRTPDELPASSPNSLSLPPVAEMDSGQAFIKEGKPVTFQSFDPTKLQTNADVFQYKGGGNAAGVTDRLKGVGQWDPIAGSDPMVVYQWSGGREDVVNGHQRAGLAKALDAQGSLPEGTRSPGFLFKEADGWTPQDVRAFAAKVNLQQGSGDVLDSARILRERPDIWDKSLPTSDLKLKQAKGLAELSDDGWGMVLNGHVKPNLAALVGQGVPDKSAHTDLLQNIIGFKNADENSTRMMIADANTAGFREEEQADIFGSTPITKSLLRERAEVYSRVIQALRDDKKVFGLLDREAERIEAAGNSLVGDVNVAQADRATQLANILEKLAVRQGPVSAALNRAATLVADGTKAPVAARAFLRDIDRLMREEGLRLVAPALPTPRDDIDVTTPKGAERATEELRQGAAPLSDNMLGSQSKAIPEQRQAIFDDMRQKLLDAGEPEERANAEAAVMAARAVARADRLGRTDPETMYREDALQVRGGKMLSGKEEGFATARGSYTQKEAGDVINLFKKRNASTFLHEAAGHRFFDELAEDASAEDASQQIKDDLQTILDWVGAKDAESITTAQREKFAKGAEQYFREGKAPSEGLRRVFEQFKQWLRAIYRSLVGLGQEIPDSIRGVMDRMIATDDEIAAARGAAREASRVPPATQGEAASAQVENYARQAIASVNAALEEGGTPLDREAREFVRTQVEPAVDALFHPQPELGAAPPKPAESIPMPGTKLEKTVDLRAAGLRPKGRGDGASSISAAQVAWATAQQSGKNAIAGIGAYGWKVLRPTEGLPYGNPHVEVTPQGVARFYGTDLSPKPVKVDGFTINAANDVPYGAGASKSSDVVNIDRHIPQFDDHVVNKEGEPLDLYKYLAIHETTEKPVMERLIAEGMPTEQAYHIAHTQHATPAERGALEADGGDWNEYEKVMDGFLSKIEHEKPENPPPDLYTKPYPHTEAEFLKREAKLQSAPTTRTPLPSPIEGVPPQVYRGYGRAEAGSAYNAMNAAVPIAGSGRYYAFSQDEAREFGPNIEAEKTSDVVKNPRVIRSGQEWRALTREAGWQVPNPFGMKEAEVRKMTNNLQALVKSQGHDGLVIVWDDTTLRDIGRNGEDIKLLRNVLGKPQVVAFGERPAVEPTIPGEQTTIPGVKPITDAERAQAGAEKPLRGGEAAPPAGGLFDEDAKSQIDWLDTVPTDDGVVPASELREELRPQTPEEKTFFQSAQTPQQAATARRQKALALKAQSDLKQYFLTHRTVDGRRDIISAAYSLFEDFGYSGNPSVRFYAEALTARTNGQIADALEHFARKTFYSDGSLVGGRRNRVDFNELQRAMFGEKTTPDVQRMASQILEALDQQRRLFNEKSGGSIGYLEKWGGPQSHNPVAIYRAGGAKDPATAKANWTAYIDPLLDWANMRDPQAGGAPYGTAPTAAERRRILDAVWEDIVTDGNIRVVPGAQNQQSTSVANSRSDHRFFKFKDADSKIAYNKNYGEGDLLTQINGHIRMMARDTALMHVFGPNPVAMLNWIKQGITKESAEFKVGRGRLLEGYDGNTVEAKGVKANKTIDGYYQQFRGDNYDMGKIALLGTILRNNAMGALLGSSVIPHAVSNPFIQMTARYYGGVPIFRAVPRIIQSFSKASKAEMLRSGLDVEQGAYSLGESARYITKLQRVANATRWFPDRVTHLSGLHPFVEANRGAIRRDLVGMLADLQNKPWSDLPLAVAKKLQGYGIRPDDWKIAAAATLHAPDVGSAPWLRPLDIENVAPEDVARAIGYQPQDPAVGLTPEERTFLSRRARDAAVKFGGYIQGETEVAVPTSSLRSRAFLFGDSDPNTFWGFLRRSAGMFKGFIGSFMLTQAQANAEQATRGPRFLNPKIFGRRLSLPHAAAIWLAMSALGTVTYSLKQLASGKEAPSLDPTTPEGRETWLHGMLTGGAFGWIGDFLASDVSSFGRGALDTLAGPAAAIAIGAGQTGWDAFTSATTKRGGHARVPPSEIAIRDMMRAFRANTPILSTLWYGRAAFNRMVLDQLQNAIDPWAHYDFRETEHRLQQQSNQKFWWRPGEITPREWPWQKSK